MNRRALLAAPAVAPALAALPAAAQGSPRIVSEDVMVPSRDAGIELFLRNKRPEAFNAFAPNRTLLMVHGATYPAHTAFDLPLEVGVTVPAAPMRVERIALRARDGVFRIAATAAPTSVELDPNVRLLFDGRLVRR